MPSLATSSGSRPRISHAPRTASRTGMARSSTSMPSALARRDLDQRRGDPAARRVAHGVDARAGSERGGHELVERGGVARDRRPSNVSPSRCERIATPWSPIGPGEQDRVARAHVARRQIDARRHDADARGVDEDLVAAAAPDHLRVAGDDRGRRRAPRPARADSTTRRRSASGSPSSRMKASDSESGCAPPTARSLTVPFTASSPMSPPGKEDRRDHVGVGGEGEPRRRRPSDDRLIVERVEERVPERRDEEALDQLRRSACRRCRGRAGSPRAA